MDSHSGVYPQDNELSESDQQEQRSQTQRRDTEPSHVSEHADSGYKEKHHSVSDQPWYNKGWVWLIVVGAISMAIFIFLSGLLHHLSQINHSIQHQTAVFKHQNQHLLSISNKISQLTLAIKNAVNDFLNGVK